MLSAVVVAVAFVADVNDAVELLFVSFGILHTDVVTFVVDVVKLAVDAEKLAVDAEKLAVDAEKLADVVKLVADAMKLVADAMTVWNYATVVANPFLEKREAAVNVCWRSGAVVSAVAAGAWKQATGATDVGA